MTLARLILVAAFLHSSFLIQAQEDSPEDSGNPVVVETSPASRDTAGSENTTPEPAVEAGTGLEADVKNSKAALRSVLDSIQTVEAELRRLEQRLPDTSEIEKPDLEEEISRLDARLESLRDDFESIATGVDPAEYEETLSREFKLSDELDSLFEPLIGELKKLTEGPREIEQLRGELSRWERRLKTTRAALRNLEAFPREELFDEVDTAIAEVKKDWEERKQQAENRIRAITYQLEQAESTQPSFLETAGEGLRSFYRSRGRNFLLCVLAFFVTFFALRFLHQQLDRRFPWKRKKRRPFYLRLIDVGFNVFSVLGAVAAAILTLYATGDWVLMGLAIIILIGVTLAAKNALPRFYEHARLLLNLGEIREGERVVYNGIPWKVQRLSFYTIFRNDRLRGGMVRLPVNQLTGLVSRPISEEGEPWFPCREGDWLMLEPEGHCRVVFQTPEYVQLVKLGGAKITVPTVDFLAKAPMNLSSGFRVSSIFGIDYQHQAISTEKIPEIMWKHITSGVRQLIGDPEQLVNLKVEFAAAGPSSLDLEIIGDFEGSLAARHQVITRALQRFAVDCCNENGWVIPFTQVTLHNAYETTVDTDNTEDEAQSRRLP